MKNTITLLLCILGLVQTGIHRSDLLMLIFHLPIIFTFASSLHVGCERSIIVLELGGSNHSSTGCLCDPGGRLTPAGPRALPKGLAPPLPALASWSVEGGHWDDRRLR